MTLRKKGCEGIIKASAARNSDIGTVPGQVVHVKCRSDYVNSNVVKGSIKKFLTTHPYNHNRYVSCVPQQKHSMTRKLVYSVVKAIVRWETNIFQVNTGTYNGF